MDYSHIYNSISDFQIFFDIKECIKCIHHINLSIFSKKNTVNIIEQYIHWSNKYFISYNKLSAYLQLTAYSNELNKDISILKKKVSRINSIFIKIAIKFSNLCKTTKNFSVLIDNSKTLLPYKHHLLQISQLPFWLSKSEMDYTYEKLYHFLSSQTPLSYEEIEDDACNCLINIKKKSVAFVKEESNSSSVLNLELLKNGLNETIFSNVLATINDCFIPFKKYITKIYSERKDNSKISYFELFNPCSDKKYDENFIIDYLLSAFYAHSKELGDLAANLLANHTFFIKNSNINSCHIKTFFNKGSEIIINPSNSLLDLFVIAHELGHAYQSSLLMNSNDPINSILSPAIEEVGSMYCENIIVPFSLNNYFGTTICKDILATYISHLFEATLDIYVRYLFEAKIFDNISHAYSASELSTLMTSIQQCVYNGYISPNKYLWISKPHFYSVSTPFYNFPYSFALFLALSINKHSINDLLIESGKMDYTVLKNKFRIDLESPNCFNLATKKINNYVETFIAM